MSKKRYSIWDWDDDFEPRVKPKQNSTASGYSYYQNIWKGFDWSSISTVATNKEDIDKFKAKVKKEADKFFLPVKVNVSGIYPEFQAFNTGKYVVNVPTDDMGKVNVPKLIKGLQKLPEKSHAIHSFWLKTYVTSSFSGLGNIIIRKDSTWYLANVSKYFDGTLSYAEFIKHFKAPEDLPKGKYGNGGYSKGLYHGGDDVGRLNILSNLSNYQEALRRIGKRLIKQEAKYFEESMRKGNRLNPKYITNQSQAPLLKRMVGGASGIPRVMIIVDCSGSMGSGKHINDRSNMSVSFAAALNNSGVADVTHIVYHSDSGWVDMKKKADKGEIAVMAGGGDGFQFMDDNLPSEWVKDIEYVLVLTDLEYGASNQGGLLDYVKRAPAHLILSFQDAPSVAGIKYERVDTIASMAKATIKLNTKLTR